jgi:hypothetical protein
MPQNGKLYANYFKVVKILKPYTCKTQSNVYKQYTEEELLTFSLSVLLWPKKEREKENDTQDLKFSQQ